MTSHKQDQKLKRSLTLPLLTFYGLGNILGAGIYVLIGKVAGSAGFYAPLAFFIASVIAAFTALTYAELSARYPLSAGEAIYVHRAFNARSISTLVGLLIALSGMVSCATMAKGFVGYLSVFFALPSALVIVLLLASLGALAAWGISQSAWVAAIFTLIDMGGLILVLWVGRASFGDLPERLLELAPLPEFAAWQGIMLGSFLAFVAFIGFEDMVNVAEEVKDPRRNIPLGIILALLIATVMYVSVALLAVLTLPPYSLAESDAPLAVVYSHATGAEPVAITLISLLAVVNGALIQIIMAARIFYGMSRNGWLPSALAYVHPKTQTPLVATVLVAFVVLALALFFPLLVLAKSTSFVILIVFALVNLALLRIKRQEPRPPGVRLFPAWVPFFGLLLTSGLVGFQVWSTL